MTKIQRKHEVRQGFDLNGIGPFSDLLRPYKFESQEDAIPGVKRSVLEIQSGKASVFEYERLGVVPNTLPELKRTVTGLNEIFVKMAASNGLSALLKEEPSIPAFTPLDGIIRDGLYEEVYELAGHLFIKNGRAITHASRRGYLLIDFKDLAREEIAPATRLARDALAEFTKEEEAMKTLEFVNSLTLLGASD